MSVDLNCMQTPLSHVVVVGSSDDRQPPIENDGNHLEVKQLLQD